MRAAVALDRLAGIALAVTALAVYPLAPAVVIEAIDREPYCQTGVMLTVSTTAGGSAKLDAGWFEPVLEQPAPGDELPAFDDRDA